MATALDDLLTASMKKPRKLLDLSKVKIGCDADFFKYMEKVPEMNLRTDQVEPEDIQIITDFSFTASSSVATAAPLQRQETLGSTITRSNRKYFYEDPLPLSMKSTRLEDLWALDIHWKMLTSDRPPNHVDLGIFERLVDLGRFALAARKQEQATIKAIMSSIIGTPAVTYLIALGFITTRSRRGTMETRLKLCKNCALELCTGAYCKLFHYEQFTRMIMDKDELESQDKEEMAFLKEVSKSAGGAPQQSSGAAAAATAAKKAREKQGKRLRMQIKKRKRKRKKKKKVKENLEPVSAPDD